LNIAIWPIRRQNLRYVNGLRISQCEIANQFSSSGQSPMQDQKDPLEEDVPALKDSGSLVPLESQHLPVPVRRKRRRSWRVAAALLVVLLGAASGGVYYVWKRMHPPLPVGISFGNGRIEADEIDISTKFAGRG
jgi:HlyD family secretion protein